MFRSLRSRLLLSYVTVIGIVLTVMTLFLLAASLSTQLRFDPVWRELIVIARSVNAEIVRARQAGIATIHRRTALAHGILAVQRLGQRAAVQGAGGLRGLHKGLRRGRRPQAHRM